MGLWVRDGRAASAPKVTTSQNVAVEMVACVMDIPMDCNHSMGMDICRGDLTSPAGARGVGDAGRATAGARGVGDAGVRAGCKNDSPICQNQIYQSQALRGGLSAKSVPLNLGVSDALTYCREQILLCEHLPVPVRSSVAHSGCNFQLDVKAGTNRVKRRHVPEPVRDRYRAMGRTSHWSQPGPVSRRKSLRDGDEGSRNGQWA